MKKILFVASALLTLSCWISSCAKELHDSDAVIEKPEDSIVAVPKDSIAEFAMDTSDLCSAVLSNGYYFKGSTLTPYEYMQVKINVTKPGIYQYSTDTLNGYYFSDAGKFVNDGAKTITLKGHGTPINVGNSKFTFKGTTIFNTIAVLDTNIVVEAVPPGQYMTGKFGDMDFHLASVSSVDNQGYGYTAQSDSTLYSSHLVPSRYGSHEVGSLVLQKQHFYPVSTSTEADFRKFFKPGAYPISYKNCELQASSSGLWVGWLDDKGVHWYVKYGLDQEGSYFNILGTEDGHRIDGQYYVKIKAKLTCKLYTHDGNKMKQFKDVEIVTYFIKGR